MPTAATSNICLLESFFRLLTAHGIRYCILRNADEAQQGVAHDVDMTVDATAMIQAEELLSTAAAQMGWKKHLKTGSARDRINIKCYHYYMADDETQRIHILHIDIFPTFTWKGYVLLNNDALLSNTENETLYHKAAEETEAVCNLFVRLLFNGYVKDKYKVGIKKVFEIKEGRVLALMQQFLSQKTAADICRWVRRSAWEKIEKARNSVIKNIRKTAPCHRWQYLRYLVDKALRRKGIVVAFQGTDGSGKSTIINRLPQVIGRTFSEDTIKNYHWRPGFVKKEKKITDDGQVVFNVQPHTEKPYGKLLSLAKMIVYVLDYSLGYWCRVRWQAAKGHLVVFDRYYYDFYMDKIRYRLNVSDAIVRVCQLFIPEPDVTFLLVGDAQQIFERKKEMSIEELQSQIECMLKNQRKMSNPIITDVSQNIHKVLFIVSKELLQVLHSRNK